MQEMLPRGPFVETYKYLPHVLHSCNPVPSPWSLAHLDFLLYHFGFLLAHSRFHRLSPTYTARSAT